MGNLLMVYAYNQWPMKPTIWDHLHTLDTLGSRHRVFYLNLFDQEVPRYLLKTRFDLVVYHYTFWAWRFNGRMGEFVARATPLKTLGRTRAALIQDDYMGSHELREAYRALNIQKLFICHPPAGWRDLYGDFVDEIDFLHVLTGYVNPHRLKVIRRLSRENPARDIDIGYRTWRVDPWLGRFGVLKAKLGDVVEQRAQTLGLNTDISADMSKNFLGDDWFRFLLRCKYSIGVEGGFSVIDPTGRIRAQGQSFVREHPNASFEEVASACFPGLDGYPHGRILSPRLFECAMTRTCQVLVEGSYFGLVKPWEHYLPLKEDFSNLDEVLTLVKEDKLREEITERAYDHLIASGRYHYASFARFIEQNTLGETQRFQGFSPVSRARAWRSRLQDRWHWYDLTFFKDWRWYKQHQMAHFWKVTVRSAPSKLYLLSPKPAQLGFRFFKYVMLRRPLPPGQTWRTVGRTGSGGDAAS